MVLKTKKQKTLKPLTKANVQFNVYFFFFENGAQKSVTIKRTLCNINKCTAQPRFKLYF